MQITYTPYFRENKDSRMNEFFRPYKAFEAVEKIDNPKILKKYRRGNSKKVIKELLKELKKEFKKTDEIVTYDKYSHSMTDNSVTVKVEGTLYRKR